MVIGLVATCIYSKLIRNNRSKAVIHLWIGFVSYVTCWFVLCCRVGSLQLCGHLLGKSWPLGCRVCCVFLCFVTFPNVSWFTSDFVGRYWRRKTGLSPPVKYFADCSKTVILLWIICVLLCFSCVAALWSPAGKGLTSWLLLVMLIVVLLLSHVVSWVRCVT